MAPSQGGYPDQVRRFPLAFVILGVLSLLAAGALVLGLVQAPTGTDLVVHNGAGETLQASAVTGHYTESDLGSDVISFTYVPGSTHLVERGPHGKVLGQRSVAGANAIGILEPVQALLGIDHFTAHGSTYRSTEPVADLVPANERREVKGTYRTTVRLAGGFVVGVHLAIRADEQGQKISQTADYHLTRVGSWETN